MNKIFKILIQKSPYDIIRNWKRKKLLLKQRNRSTLLLDLYLETTGIKKLQIGCGTNEIEGWYNTDLNASKSISYLDAGSIFPINDKTFDFIYNEHIFEHLTIKQQINMLSEAYRVLKEGGVLRTATPNASFLVDLYKDPKNRLHQEYIEWSMIGSPYLQPAYKLIEDRSIDHIFILSNFFKAWGHQVIHDKKSFEALGKQIGFSKIRFCEVGESEIEDLRNIEKHGTIIPQRFNKLETMVIEFIK